MTRSYQIASAVFSIVYLNEVRIKTEEPFRLFAVDKEGEVIFQFHEGMPDLLPDMNLYYSDDRNLVYTKDTVLYRYIGNFIRKDRKLESQSCVAYDRKNPRQADLYFQEANHVRSEGSVLSGMGIEQLLARFHHVILHSSFIVSQGKGIVFSAPSGTGKSTQADLWEKYIPGTEIINGDRSVLSIRKGQAMVSGLPFCGSSGIAKPKEAVLSAIVILRQGEENRIRKLKQAEAVRYLYSECSVNPWDQEGTEHILQVLEQVTAAVPVYYYVCRKDVTAVETLYHTI